MAVSRCGGVSAFVADLNRFDRFLLELQLRVEQVVTMGGIRALFKSFLSQRLSFGGVTQIVNCVYLFTRRRHQPEGIISRQRRSYKRRESGREPSNASALKGRIVVTRTIFQRIAMTSAGLTLALTATAAHAPAALDMSLGERRVVTGQSIAACNAAAKAALNGVLNSAIEIGNNTGEWEGLEPASGPDGTTATAAIHCFPLGSGYVVTFTCSTQVPPNPDSANALCSKLSAAFSPEGK